MGGGLSGYCAVWSGPRARNWSGLLSASHRAQNYPVSSVVLEKNEK